MAADCCLRMVGKLPAPELCCRMGPLLSADVLLCLLSEILGAPILHALPPPPPSPPPTPRPPPQHLKQLCMCCRLFLDNLDSLLSGESQKAAQPQDESQVSHANKLDKQEGRMLWDMTAEQLHNQVDAWRHTQQQEITCC